MADSHDHSRRTSRSRSYHKGNVAKDLRNTAERMLSKGTLEEITIRRLTKEVGVSPANFYNHYDGIEDLLSSIASSYHSKAVDNAIEIWSRPGAKSELLVESAVNFIKFCLQNRQLMRLILRKRKDDHCEECGTASRSFREVVRFIYGDSDESTSPTVGYEGHGMAYGYIAITYGFALLLLEERFRLDAENEEELSRFIRSGILPFLDGSTATILSNANVYRGPSC